MFAYSFSFYAYKFVSRQVLSKSQINTYLKPNEYEYKYIVLDYLNGLHANDCLLFTFLLFYFVTIYLVTTYLLLLVTKKLISYFEKLKTLILNLKLVKLILIFF